MKKAVLLLFGFIWAFQVQSEELVACIDEHPPYQVLAERPYGTHITALEVLAEVLDKRLTFIRSPNFARCIALLKKGHADVIAGLNPSEERNQFAFFAPFKAADKLKVVSKKGLMINQYDDFYDKVIGVSRGVAYFPRFDDDTKLKKMTVQNVSIGISLLVKGRVDILMLSPANFATLVKQNKDLDLVISPIEFAGFRNKETAFGFSQFNKLGMTQQMIQNKVKTAYQAGRFQ